MGQPYLTQVAFAWGTDDNSNPNSNTLGTEGADITGVVKNVKKILHILVKNTDAAAGSKNWQLYYNTTDNPATASQVVTAGSGGTVIVMADGQPTDGASITSRRLSDPTGTWQNGFYTDGDASSKLALAGTDGYTEFQFCLLADSSAGDNTDYFFYLRLNLAAMDAHTDVPKLTTEAVVGTQEITPVFVDSVAAIPTHAVTVGPVALTPDRIESVAAVGTHAISTTVDVAPIRIESVASIPTHAISTTVDAAPVLIESAATVPIHAMTTGVVNVAPTRIESEVSIPTHDVSADLEQDVVPNRVESQASVGTHAVTTGVVDLAASRIESTASVGTHAITSTVDLAPVRIGSQVQIPLVTNLFIDGGMEIWISATNLLNWNENISASTINQDGAIQRNGLYSCRMDVVNGEAVDLHKTVALAATTRYHLAVYGRTDIDKNIYIYVRDITAGKNWSPIASSWDSGVVGIVKSSVGVFGLYVQEFPSVGANNYIFSLRRHSSGNYSGWWDDALLSTVLVNAGTVNLTPSRIESTVSIPTPNVAVSGGPQGVLADVIPSAATVPIHAVTTGAVNLTTSRIESTVSIPTHAVTATVNVTPTRVESAVVVPTPVITTGAVNISPTILPSQVTVPIHAAAVEGGPQDAEPSRIESAAQVFTAAVITGAVNVVPSRIESEATISIHSLGTVIIPSRIESIVSIPTHALAAGAVNITTSRIESTAQVFTASVAAGAVDLTPSRIESEVTIPTQVVGATYDITPDRIDSTVSVAIHSVTVGATNITVAFVESEAQVFTHTIFAATLVREVIRLTSEIGQP